MSSKSNYEVPDDPKSIDPTLQELRQTFLSGKTKPLSFRKQQLQNLLRGMKESVDALHEAHRLDLGYENIGVTNLFAIAPTSFEIEYILANLDSWANSEQVDTNLFVGPGSSYITPEPFGVALIIGAWNYPIFTGINPACIAIAAGNCVCLKPSELAPNCSRVIREIFEKYVDQSCYRVLQGAIEVAKIIATRPWDLIIFTGSPQKGRLVARAASDNLVPCILELGGKSPTIIDKDANLKSAALRIVAGKFGNAGQTCVAPDYLMVEESVLDKFIDEMKVSIEDFYTKDASKSTDYSRVITPFHTKRLIDIIKDNHGGKIVYGGVGFDEKSQYFPPTLVLNPNPKSRMLNEEIFGPILPIIPYQNIQDVVSYINQRQQPLALYYFGESKDNRKLLESQTSSGAFVQNECIFHILNHQLPFGGVGNSGYGSLNGKIGFRNCSHMKPVLLKGTLNAWPTSCRFPPYTENQVQTMAFLGKFANVYIEKAVRNLILFVLFLVFVFYGRKYFFGNKVGEL